MKFVFEIKNANKVVMKGSWDEWNNEIVLDKNGDQFSTDLALNSGEFIFKFIIDGNWTTVDDYEHSTTSDGFVNNRIVIKEPLESTLASETIETVKPVSVEPAVKESSVPVQEPVQEPVAKESIKSTEETTVSKQSNVEPTIDRNHRASVEQLIDQFDAIKVNPVVLEKKDSILGTKGDETKQDYASSIKEEGKKHKKKRWTRIFK